jgi:hypothetical protein
MLDNSHCLRFKTAGFVSGTFPSSGNSGAEGPAQLDPFPDIDEIMK